MAFWWRLAASMAIASLMAMRGLRKRSLSRSGAIAAVVVGTLHMASGFRFGLTLIMFYLTSSKLTRYRADIKAQVEADFREGGQRTASQVLANSLGGSILAVAATLTSSFMAGSDYRLVYQLLGGFLGHYSCCCADTWASELGVLANASPRLITTGKIVPRGTNGGVTLEGCTAGVAGGGFIGLVMWLGSAADPTFGGPRLHALTLIPLGAALGAAGSAIDSVLGATVQYSGVCTATGKAVQCPMPGVRHVSGRALLSNDGVNLVASALTALVGAWAGSKVYLT